MLLKTAILFALFAFSLSLICPPKAPFCFDIKEVNELAQFTLEGPLDSGYISIGLGTNMNSCEIFSGFIDSKNKPKIAHSKGVGYKSPELVKDDDTILLASEESGIFPDKMRFVFTKAFHSNISTAFNINKSGTNKILWAYSTKKPKDDGKVGKHQVYGALDFDLGSKKATSNINESNNINILVLAHGFIMLISWLILPSISIFIARFLKDRLGHMWFRLHYLCFLFAGVLSIISIILAYIVYGNNFNSIHSIIGLTVMTLYGIQIGLGVLIDKLWDQDRKSIPIQDKIHWWLGRLILLIATGNIAYGIILVGSYLALWATFSASLFLISITFTFGHFKLKKTNH